jgi:U3 small nucleolar RNA-associated protein 7
MSHNIARGAPSSFSKPVVLTHPTASSKYIDRNHTRASTSGAKQKSRPNSNNRSSKGSYVDRKTENLLQRHEYKTLSAADSAASAEILQATNDGFIETENEMERTYKLKMKDIQDSVDEQTSRQIYDLKMPQSAPYSLAYSTNGRSLLLAGRTGHVASIDAITRGLNTEIQLTDPPNSITGCTFLHNDTMFALAEKKAVYIYDDKGAEIHMLSDHIDPLALSFLPHHWLLSSIGRSGYLKYTDTSTGTKVAEIRTKLGQCGVMRVNSYNSVTHLGHGNGQVTLYSPSVSTPLVKMLAHRGPVTSLAIDLSGKYMVTSGADRQVKVWDIRMFKEMHSYFSHWTIDDVDISQNDVLAVAAGGVVNIWKDALGVKQKDPYLSHRVTGGVNGASCSLNQVRFRPFEDVLGIGHSNGFSSIVIPGAGSAAYDSYENNMFQDKKQRQESEVRSLLEKISPDLIALDPNALGEVERDRREVVMEQREMVKEAREKKKEADAGKKEKKKARGRNKISKKLAKKHKNIVDEAKVKLAEKKRDMAEKRGEEVLSKEERRVKTGKEEGDALSRFF